MGPLLHLPLIGGFVNSQYYFIHRVPPQPVMHVPLYRLDPHYASAQTKPLLNITSNSIFHSHRRHTSKTDTQHQSLFINVDCKRNKKRRILKKVLFSTLYSTERDKKKASGFEKDNTVLGSFKSNTNFCFQHKLINEMCEICSVVCT